MRDEEQSIKSQQLDMYSYTVVCMKTSSVNLDDIWEKLLVSYIYYSTLFYSYF